MCAIKLLLHMTCAIFAVIALGLVTVEGETESMARMTRPEIFANPDDLKQYLEFIKGYYSLNGKARYGKRKDVYSIERLKSLRTLDLTEQKQENPPNILKYKKMQEKNKLKYFQPFDSMFLYEI